MKFLVRLPDMPEGTSIILAPECPAGYLAYGVKTCDDCGGLEKVMIALPGLRGERYMLELDGDEWDQIANHVSDKCSHVHGDDEAHLVVPTHEAPETKQ
jgi:hypothetical protein